MITEEQLDVLTEIATVTQVIEIQSLAGSRATICPAAIEAIISLYKLGIIPYTQDKTRLIQQFTVCCNLANDAYSGYAVATDYKRLAAEIGLEA